MQRNRDINSRIVASCDKKLVEEFKTDIYIEGRLSQFYLVQGARLTLLTTSKTRIRAFMARHQLSRRAEPSPSEFAALICDLGWHKASMAALENLVPKLLAWIEREATRIGVMDINVRKINGRLEIGDSVWPAHTLDWLRSDWNGDTNGVASGQTRPTIHRMVRLGPTGLTRLTLQALAEGSHGPRRASVPMPTTKVETIISPSALRTATDFQGPQVSSVIGTDKLPKRHQTSTPSLEPIVQEVIRRVMADQPLLNSSYMARAGTARVERDLTRVLSYPPSIQLYQTLSLEVQEVLLETILNLSRVAYDEFETYIGPLSVPQQS